MKFKKMIDLIKEQEDFLNLLKSKEINFAKLVNFSNIEKIDLNYMSKNFNQTNDGFEERRTLFELLIIKLNNEEFLQIMEKQKQHKILHNCQGIFLAIKNNKRKIIQYFLDKKINLDVNNIFRGSNGEEKDCYNSVLMNAAFELDETNNDLFQIILDRTKNINNRSEITYYNGDIGNDNAANYAAYNGDVKKLEMLYLAGVNFSNVEVDEETTPCQQLYKVLKEKNELDLFVNFMEKYSDLLTLEINRKTKLLDKYFQYKLHYDGLVEYFNSIESILLKMNIENNLNLQINNKIIKKNKI
jgi:hypothetical protein